MNLLARIAIGDTSILTLVYDRYSTPMYSLAFQVMASDSLAAQIVEEVFVELWRAANANIPLGIPLAVWLLQQTQTYANVMKQQSEEAILSSLPVHETQADRHMLLEESQLFLWPLIDASEEPPPQHII